MTRKFKPTLVAASLAFSIISMAGGCSYLQANSNSDHAKETKTEQASAIHTPSQDKTKTPIEHIVVIFDENISFDHYFGTYPHATNPKGEPAFHAKPDTPPVNGLTPELLHHNPNRVNPFLLARDKEPCDQDHEYEAEQEAYNGGLVNQFVSATGNKSSKECQHEVMGYYDGNTVTALWNYAQHFSLNDNSYGTIFGPSTPGALNLVAGTTGKAFPTDAPDIVNGNLVGDVDPRFDDCSYKSPAQAKAGEQDAAKDGGLVYIKGQNIGNLLNDKGVTWGWFEGGFDPSSRTKSGIARCDSVSTNIFGGQKKDYIPHHEPFQYYKSTSNPHHLAPSSIAMVGKTDRANHQYSLKTFWKAADSGHLPAVSFLKAKGVEDAHAGYSNPLDEQKFLVRTINRLQKLPSWKHTAVIIAYDDSDGYYDHVMPPKNHFANEEGRAGYGPRLPLLVISPYAKQNHVDHTLTDQASIIHFIEKNWQLGHIKHSMDKHSGTLENMFNFQKPDLDPKLFLNPNTGEVVS
ncbi:alkaline phosphatase family protein [Vibrio marisflavi]|uniref:Phospholipase C 3 n=1 Tax=Vibrio marisflavi CECT 7928 TaxID=634439 RepID=A0ABN8E317_9VIBR|nr:alkaline phosphatase family protein [Vibrio marisflavi]CAH0537724.1 Phospholipase C 3 [Vibrio marisflavi CECT 7928]